MPAASSMAMAKKKSEGVHGSAREKDVSKAAHYKKIRDLYDLRSQYWS
jgi:hypothetical protein